MFSPGYDGMTYQMSGEASYRISQFTALEGQEFVLISCQILTAEGAKKVGLGPDSPFIELPGGGFSAIFGPDGTPLTAPVPPGKEALLYADIALHTIDYAKEAAVSLYLFYLPHGQGLISVSVLFLGPRRSLVSCCLLLC
jgi:nitrilase